jgi:hypothetical protein
LATRWVPLKVSAHRFLLSRLCLTHSALPVETVFGSGGDLSVTSIATAKW